MKKSLLVALVCLSVLVPSLARSADLSLGGLQDLATDKLKEAKPAGIINFNGEPAVAAFLPVYTFHNMSGVDYAEIGVGGKWQDGEKAMPFAAVDFNLIGISKRLWDIGWVKDHMRMTAMPPIFLGPYFELPLDIPKLKGWTWGANAGVMFSVRFGGKS